MSTPIGKPFTAGVEGYLCRNETIIFEENMLTVSAHFVFILLKWARPTQIHNNLNITIIAA